MHFDLLDAIEFVVSKGIARKDKIAIFGASYGGKHLVAFNLIAFKFDRTVQDTQLWLDSPLRPMYSNVELT